MGGIGGAIGSAVGTGLDVLLNRPGANASALPEKLILSSNVQLVMTGADGETVSIAQWDQMRKQKLMEEKKRFKPYGSMKTISLSKDLGWELVLSGQKTSGKLDRFIAMHEKMLNGIGISSIASEANTFNSSNVIGIKPLFEIVEIINDKGSYNFFTYRDVSIIGYDETVPNDNNPIEYSLTLFSPSRDLMNYGTPIDDSELETVLDKIIVDLVNRNKQ